MKYEPCCVCLVSSISQGNRHAAKVAKMKSHTGTTSVRAQGGGHDHCKLSFRCCSAATGGPVQMWDLAEVHFSDRDMFYLPVPFKPWHMLDCMLQTGIRLSFSGEPRPEPAQLSRKFSSVGSV
eukprot:CAMPEP_0172578838 /NCGR_PEP_ID=MMETSP1067-20121228/138940_1 /TAXON_ID=265564 ORGANISM="Thalassiosira punctigera, Strain Tpunct2005C2" /NCGR_SAMPLE_ID=MMETSP1067 /ASSEMBLY_ACC=CAM_ASM_000444 /LENGTH=122 /DNA_ID=CAMNT_0013371543 /DNA_START=821 /DNA_END=1190 /DNA_ORIENTATION=-